MRSRFALYLCETGKQMRKLLTFGLWLAMAQLEAQNPWLSLQKWVGVWKELRSEVAEQWIAAAPDTLRGARYLLTLEGPVLSEQLVLFRRPDGRIVYRIAMHEHNGGHPTDFTLTFFTASSWTFENLERDFPQVIEYWFVDSTSLRITLSSEAASARDLWLSRASESVLRVRPKLRGYEAWVCNHKSGSVERFDAHTGAYLGRVYAGPSPARAICLGPSAQVYVLAVGKEPTVYRVDAESGTASPFLGGQALQAPTCLAFSPDGRYLYVGEQRGDVLCFDGATGHFVRKVVEGLAHPVDLAWDAHGQMLVACMGGRGVWLAPTANAPLHRLTPEGVLKAPTGLCVAPNGDLLVADADQPASIKRFQRQGDGWTYPEPLAYGFGWPEGLTLGPDGYLYACDSGISVVRKIDLATNADLGIYLEGSALKGPSVVIFRKRP